MKNNNIDFSIRIGIFYKTKEWADRKCEEIYGELVDYSDSGTCRRYTTNDNNMIIDLGNGSYIKFVPADDRSRGHKFNRIYYQEGVNEEMIYCRIYPALYNPKPESLQ